MTTAHAPVTEFFPTPTAVIRQLVAPVAGRLIHSTILEPSAGKGDILDHLVEYHQVSKDNVYAIEINPELQLVLTGKGYRLLGSDFLQFHEPYRFDIILMNPPFGKGAEHALKAWDLVADGGTVVCLLNAETLRNPYTKKRQLLKRIVDKHGRAEYLGQAFKTAARAADVDVVMIVLDKPERERLGYVDGETFDTDAPEHEPSFSAAPLAQRNVIQSLVAQYDVVVELARERAALDREIEFYTRDIADGKSRRLERPPGINQVVSEIKEMFWRYVFDKTQLGNLATSQFLQEFEEMRQQNQHLAFTVENITAIVELLITNYDKIIRRCIVDVFDEITRFHEKNTVHTEGWKTNKSWKIGPKIIVPRGVCYDKWGWTFAHSKSSFYDDLDKAVCFVAGRKFEELRREWKSYGEQEPARTIEDSIRDHIRDRTDKEWNEKFKSAFFEIKVHKKGTVHLWFRHKAHLEQLNEEAARGKGWLGPGY